MTLKCDKLTQFPSVVTKPIRIRSASLYSSTRPQLNFGCPILFPFVLLSLPVGLGSWKKNFSGSIYLKWFNPNRREPISIVQDDHTGSMVCINLRTGLLAGDPGFTGGRNIPLPGSLSFLGETNDKHGCLNGIEQWLGIFLLSLALLASNWHLPFPMPLLPLWT